MSEEVLRQPEETPPALPEAIAGVEPPEDDLLEMLLGSWSQEPELELLAASGHADGEPLLTPEGRELQPEFHDGDVRAVSSGQIPAAPEPHPEEIHAAVAHEAHLVAAVGASTHHTAAEEPHFEVAETFAVAPVHHHEEAPLTPAAHVIEDHPATAASAHAGGFAFEPAPVEHEIHVEAAHVTPLIASVPEPIATQLPPAVMKAAAELEEEQIYFELPLETIEPLEEPVAQLHVAADHHQPDFEHSLVEEHADLDSELDPDLMALLELHPADEEIAEPALQDHEPVPQHAEAASEPHSIETIQAPEIQAHSEVMEDEEFEAPVFDLSGEAFGEEPVAELPSEEHLLVALAAAETVQVSYDDLPPGVYEPEPVAALDQQAEPDVEAPVFDLAEADAVPFDDSQWPGQDDLAAMLANFTSEDPSADPATSYEGEDVELPDLLEGDFFHPAAHSHIAASDEGMLEDLIASIDMEIQQVPLPLTARELAQRESTQTTRYVVFTVSGKRFGLPMTEVLETERLPRITALPNVPEFVHGITNLRGEIVPLLDTRSLLGLGDWDQSARASMLIVRQSQDEQLTGLIVDDVNGLADVLADSVHAPTIPVAPQLASVLTGVCEHRDQELSLINLQAFFASPELQQLAAQ